MKKKLTPGRFLLLLSLAVNVAFVLGYLHAFMARKEVTNRKRLVKVIERRLHLTPEQASTFRKLRAEADQASVSFKKAVAVPQAVFWKELSKKKPDRERLFSSLSQVHRETLTFNRQITDLLLRFLDILSPRQRAQFIKIIHGRSLYGGRFIMGGK